MRKTLTFIFVFIISFTSSFTYWFHSNQVGEYVSLSVYKPLVYRQLAPMLVRSLTWFGVPANWAIVLVMTAAGIGFFYALRALVYQFYNRQLIPFTPFPKLPEIVPVSNHVPDKLIAHNSNGDIFVTKNFDSDTPTWKKYKRLGWAYRYLDEKKHGKEDNVSNS